MPPAAAPITKEVTDDGSREYLRNSATTNAFRTTEIADLSRETTNGTTDAAAAAAAAVLENDSGDTPGLGSNPSGGNGISEAVPAFSWDFLDRNQTAMCGADKCLLRSRFRLSADSSGCGGDEHEHEHHRIGYLVSRDGKGDESIFDGWKISRYLTGAFGIRHFLLEPPIRTTLHRSVAETLFGPTNATEQIFPPLVHSDSMATTVQKIRIAPEDSRELRLKQTKDEVVELLEELLLLLLLPPVNDTHTNYGDAHQAAASPCGNTTTTTTPLPEFLKTLDAEIAATHDLLLCEPLLALDFQFMVDAKGTLYHLDFDRVLSQLGGLRGYNQTAFDAKVRFRLDGARRLLSTVRQWIKTKQHQLQGRQQRDEKNLTNNTNSVIRWRRMLSAATTTTTTTTADKTTTTTTGCRGDWEAEESAVLVSHGLPCLATERVAIARHTTTSTMNHGVAGAAVAANSTSATTTGNHRRGHHRHFHDDRVRHPLLVALLRRVIRAGHYGTNASIEEGAAWDCDAYGDRVLS
jgi:hypothetical protein